MIGSLKMLNNPLISIIVPIYNAELYLERCLNSITTQTYQNIEVILVNDGSTDRSKAIAEVIVNTDPRFKIINQANAGVASARQVGLNNSNGEFIIHCDSDDMIVDFAIEKLVKKALLKGADIIVGGYIVKYGNKEIYIGMNEKEDYEGFVEGLLLGKYHGSLCNKLIKKDLYNLISFDSNINYMEDKLVLAKILSNGPYKISFLDEAIYIYQQNKGSLTNNISMASIKSSVIVVDIISQLYRNKVSEDIVNKMIKKRRFFEVIESAKNGVNVITKDDDDLLKDIDLSVSAKLEWWLVKNNMLQCLKIASATKVTLYNLINRNALGN